MEIIDLKKMLDKEVEPVCKLEGKLFLRETVKVFDDLLKDSDIINYYTYDIENNKISHINIGKEKILLDFFQQSEVEGEDGFYYLTVKKQILINEYTLNSVNINTSEITSVLKFEMDTRFNNLLIEKLEVGEFLVFFKQEHQLTFEEFESFETSIESYGYEKAILYNVNNGKSFEVEDKAFLRGLRSVFFKTTLKNEECVVYEENYLEPYDKQQIYNEVHRGRKSKKDQFFYWDSLKYLPLKKFISEIEGGYEKLSFVDMEIQGLDGYEFFSGVDKENIYYEVNKFGKENSDAMIILNKESLEKKTIKLLSECEGDAFISSSDYYWNLDGKYKVIFRKSLISNKQLKVKEIINGNIDYNYEKKLGYPKECINSRYLITSTIREGPNTSIIDMETDKIQTHKKEHTVFDDYLVLF
ncbi:hypothetical protein G9F71_005535 [Clostridium sp. FP2]|uniref:hypothetical protein n=1 Tax=Clostridium TaxID=1485 RepID=UPI0013E9917F|nr:MULTISPECIES: hypothetical protein [Clostridium]MBW9158257.1 hypothetical protein [Clostridium tagluense]MBZ9622308.1 hypothetical protein [Clostridium sp. FP2]WLC66614.1 hypothetical protein KTC93_05325 [Clostridium tagluense]